MKIIIIGAGPGGYETAVLAAKKGVEVVLIEGGPVGGTCLNEGCIPTKAFCRNAEIVDELARAEEFGLGALSYELDFAKVAARKDAVVEQLRAGVEGLLRNKLITLVRGWASFKDSKTVLVEGVEYTADAVIIATGSVSASLPIPGAELAVTSREMLQLTQLPKRLCVIGAGVIGLEFASIFRSFGCEVSVVEYCKDILPRFDTDLAKRLKQSLGKRGISIETAAQVTAIVKTEDGLSVRYTKKEQECSAEADLVLMAVGRRANYSGLNLEAAGVETSRRGIVVDANMMTSVPGIYAIGDVNGQMMLAHAATYQGIKALRNILGEEDGIDLSVMPAAVFTNPEVATVGLTEDEAKEKGIAVKCLKSFFRANGKALTLGEPDGYCKIVVAAEGCEAYAPGRILGCHMFGAHSSDLVQEICALISRGATLSEAADIIHTHPSLSEVVQSALHSA